MAELPPKKTETIKECWTPFEPVTAQCPDDCLGLLAAKFIVSGSYEYQILVCPNPATLGQPNREVVMCGLGDDMIIMRRDTVPTDVEYAEAVNNFGQ